MVLGKAKSRLKHHANLHLILNEYIMTDKNCTREKLQGWGLIRRLKTWNKPSRRAWNRKVMLPGKNKKYIPNISGEMQPSHSLNGLFKIADNWTLISFLYSKHNI